MRRRVVVRRGRASIAGARSTGVARGPGHCSVDRRPVLLVVLHGAESLLEPFEARGRINRGLEPCAHTHAWHYYIGLLAYSASGGLTWSEGIVLLLALGGIWSAWRGDVEPIPGRLFWTRYLAGYAAVTTAIFSALPYKTPWNILPFYAGVLVVAGIGFSWLVRATPSRLARAAVTCAVAIASLQLGWQAWRASVTYAADPRNPYVYAQTVPDAVRMASRIRDLAALDRHGAAMQVSVIASPYEQWPLPGICAPCRTSATGSMPGIRWRCRPR